MRKFLILPLLLLLLVACGSAAESEPTTGEETPAAIQESGSSAEEKPTVDNSAQTNKASVNTGSTPEEASIVREQDYSKGAEEPTVTIIEYGDFQ